MKKFTITEYKYDDPELVDAMKWLSGSEEWYKTHKMHFSRSSSKKFYVLRVEGVFAGICTRKGKYIGDRHILPEYRGQGYGTELLKYVTETGTWCVSENPVCWHQYRNLGYTHVGYRGHFQVWKKLY